MTVMMKVEPMVALNQGELGAHFIELEESQCDQT
jgi:hypothetical protein